MAHKYTFDELLAMDSDSFENLYEKSWKANNIINNQRSSSGNKFSWTKYDTKDVIKSTLLTGAIIFSAWSITNAIEKFAPRRERKSQK